MSKSFWKADAVDVDGQIESSRVGRTPRYGISSAFALLLGSNPRINVDKRGVAKCARVRRGERGEGSESLEALVSQYTI